MRYAIILNIVLIVGSVAASQTSDPVASYLQFLESKTSHQHLSDEVRNSPLSDIKHFARMIFDATNVDPVRLDRGIVRSHKAHDALTAPGPTVASGFKIGFVEYAYLSQVDSSLSKLVYALSRIPYCLTMVIQSVKGNSYLDVSSGSRLPQTVVEASPLHIYKGALTIRNVRPMRFFFMNYWLNNTVQFKPGDTCLVFLDYREYPEGSNGEFDLIVYLDNGDGYFPVKNAILRDQFNTFGKGIEVSWPEFDRDLRDQLTLIESW